MAQVKQYDNAYTMAKSSDYLTPFQSIHSSPDRSVKFPCWARVRKEKKPSWR